MRKHDILRGFLTDALPELKRNPEALSLHIEKGRIVSWHGPNLGWEYRYDLRLFYLEYRGAPEQLFLPVTLWLRQYQPELLLDHEAASSAVQFNIDVVDLGTHDVEILLPLTEVVDVLKQEDGSYAMTLRDEPPIAGTEPFDGLDPTPLLKQIYAPSGPAREFLVGYPDDE